MAMTNAGMSSAINTAIMAIPGITIVNALELSKFCDALGAAIVSYIQANAVVTPDTLAITPAAIIAPVGGGACSGLGTVTTGTGKIL